MFQVDVIITDETILKRSTEKAKAEDSGLQQLISSGERFKPSFAERDKDQTMMSP
jgi:hypothetical protein